MNIDFSKMTDEELKKFEKEVREERRNRIPEGKNLSKDQLENRSRVYQAISGKTLVDPTSNTDVVNVMSREIHWNICKVCDSALHNYFYINMRELNGDVKFNRFPQIEVDFDTYASLYNTLINSLCDFMTQKGDK